MKEITNSRLTVLLLLFYFLFGVIVPPGFAQETTAAENTPIYSAEEMAQRAVDFIHEEYIGGENIDGYTAFVLHLAGEDLESEKWTRNGQTLKEEIQDLAGLLGNKNSLIDYIVNTQNEDGSFGPFANEYGTKVPLQALAKIKPDLKNDTVIYERVDDSINNAIDYFKTKYQNGSIIYEVNGWNFDYRCVEALVDAGEDISVDDWVYDDTSLEDAVIASAGATADAVSQDSSVVDAVYLAKEMTVLNTLDPDSENIRALAGAIVDKQNPDGSFGDSIYKHVMVLSALGKAGYIGEIDQDKALNYINNLKQEQGEGMAAWGSNYSGSFQPEPDLTAQVLTALSYFEGADDQNSEVYKTIQDGLAYLLDIQDPETAAVTAQWDSTFATAETLIALKSLGYKYNDYAGEDSPWVKKSKTKTIAQCLLALHALNDSTGKDRLAGLLADRQLDDEPGKGSFENSVYSDMLAYIALGEAGKLDQIKTDTAREYILSKQQEDGSWGEIFGSDYYPDFLSSAQAIRALALLPGAQDDDTVQKAIEKGLNYFKTLQKDDGGVYATPFDDPAVDNSEVIITLYELGLNPEGAQWTNTVEGRRVNPVSFLMTGTMNADGSFGTSKNVLSATEALYAYVMQKEKDIIAVVNKGIKYLHDQYFSDGTSDMYKQYGGARAIRVLTLAGEELAGDKWIKDGKSLADRVKEDAANLDQNSPVTDIAKTLIALSGLQSGANGESQKLADLIAAKQKDGGNFADGEIYNEMLPYLALTMAEKWDALSATNRDKAKKWLVNAQSQDGSWQHSWGVDTVSTAQAIVVLSSFDDAQTPGTDTYRAVQDALNWLKSKQATDGNIDVQFDDPVTDTAETVLAVLAAGQNPGDADWTENGNSLLDYLLSGDNRNEDGSIGDKEKYSGNVGSTVPALLALLEYNLAHGWIDFDYVQDSSDNNDGSNSGGDSGGQPVEDRCSVYVKVIDKDEETLFDDRVTINEENPWGFTALGALHATGLDYNATGGFVDNIAGQANSGLDGWMYKVNDTVPEIAADKKTVAEGDRITWWYSTDPSQIPGGSSPITETEENSPVDDELLEKLEETGEARLNVSGKSGGKVSITLETVNKLAEEGQPLIVENNDIELEFTGQALIMGQIDAALEEGTTSLEIQAREVDVAEKQEILTQAIGGESSGLLDIGGKIFELNASLVLNGDDETVNREKVESFKEPVKVTIDLADLKLSEQDAALLTAVRFVKDGGDFKPEQLGGSYDPKTKTFTFYTDSFSYYGICKNKERVIITLQIEELNTTVNGDVSRLDVPPTIYNNRTVVPLRFVSQCLGADIEWIQESKTVEINMGDRQLTLRVGEEIPGFDTPATIIDGRSFVPVRYVSESFGAEVTWDVETKTVKIVK